MRIYCQNIILIFLLLTFLPNPLKAQEEKVPYEKHLTINMGAGPALLGIDYGILFENQFILEVRKYFSLSASYGTAHAYEGMDDVKREYSPLPDLGDDDFTRQQTLIYARMGLEFSPLNTKHHRVYAGIGPSINFLNFSGGNIIATADTTVFILSNSKSRNFTYSFSAGYDLRIKEHYFLGLCFYYTSYSSEPTYSAILRGGYRF